MWHGKKWRRMVPTVLVSTVAIVSTVASLSALSGIMFTAQGAQAADTALPDVPDKVPRSLPQASSPAQAASQPASSQPASSAQPTRRDKGEAELLEISVPIGPKGGEVSLPGYSRAIFPAGVFTAIEQVKLAATRSAETADDFHASAFMYEAGIRLPYELRIITGKSRPRMDITVVIHVPPKLFNEVPAGSELNVFAQMFQDGGQEVLDQFELYHSTTSKAEGTISVILPPDAFTNRRHDDENYEAIVLLATTPASSEHGSDQNEGPAGMMAVLIEPGIPSDEYAVTAVKPRLLAWFDSRLAKGKAICHAAHLGSPVDERHVTSAFNGRSHYGTDYRAANGTKIYAMANGIIERIGYDARKLRKADARSGKKVKGWGRYVVIKHSDGSRTLYAHLEKNGVKRKPGERVAKGEVIALSNNSGGSNSPHLHVEYAPSGKIYQHGGKIDPEACITSGQDGSHQRV